QVPGRTAVIESAECAPAALGCAAWRRECMQLAAAGSGRAARAGGRTNVARAMIRAEGVSPAPVSEATGRAGIARATERAEAVSPAGVTEVRPLASERLAIDERPAARDVGVVVEDDGAMTPVASPVAPSPAEAREEPDPEAYAEDDSRLGDEQARIRIPPRPRDDRRAVHEPWIVLRHVDDLGIRRLDHDLGSLLDDLLLWRGVQVTRLLRPPAHDLDGVHHVLLMVDVGVS